MKRASSWSLQLYSPYVALALFLILIITTINYISLSSQQRSLMARGDHTQKERDLLEVSLVRNETSLGPPSLKRDPILGSNLRLRYLQSVPKNAQFFIEMPIFAHLSMQKWGIFCRTLCTNFTGRIR